MKNNLTVPYDREPGPAAGRITAHRNPRRLAAKNILVPIDFSAGSRRAAIYAEKVGRRIHAGVTWVHVAKPVAYQADYGYGAFMRHVPDLAATRRAKARLKMLALKLKHSGGLERTLVSSGKASTEIIRAARAVGAHLIIMGAPREHPSVAAEVVREAPCSVFVLSGK